MVSILTGLAMICVIVYGLWLALRIVFDDAFWRPSPWLSPVDGTQVTEQSVSDLLYCIAQESAYAQHHMALLCSIGGVPFPPQPDTTRSGHCSVPPNVAPSSAPFSKDS